MPAAAVDPFAPPGQEWVRVSPRLASLRRTVTLVLGGLLVLAAAAATWLISHVWTVGTVVVGALIVGWIWVAVGRRVRSWGYAERADDLLVTRGLLVRRLVVVPYGRMQFVDVTAGPLDRRFRLATVQLHTAAAATDATIPGLAPEEATRLRDRLAARGEARAAGV